MPYDIVPVAAISARVHVTPGGGPVFMWCGIALLAVGAIVILAAPSMQKRVGLAPDQTEPPGPAQIWISRIIGGAFCVVGLGMLLGGIRAVSLLIPSPPDAGDRLRDVSRIPDPAPADLFLIIAGPCLGVG